MKIVSGIYGDVLKTLEGKTTRPTSDKVRGAIFNMIGPYFEGDVSWISMLVVVVYPSRQSQRDVQRCPGGAGSQSTDYRG